MGVFAELLACPGVVEESVLASPFGVMAFHGGSLEEGTDAIARHVADAAGASLYVVALPAELQWHVPSRLVTADESPELAAFLDHVDTVVALHGYGRAGMWTSLLLGGVDRELATRVGTHVRAALPHYEVVTELDRIPAELRGLHPDNPVNRARGGGVQLELPPRIRGMSPRSTPADTIALVDGLAAAASALAEGRA